MSRRVLIPLLLASLTVPLAVAQDNSDRGDRGGERGARGDRGGERGDRDDRRFDPAAMQQRFMDMIKQQMGVTDEEEWKVIQAKLQPVMQKRMESGLGGMMGGFRGRGGPGDNDGDNRQRSAVAQASRELRTTLQDENATEDQIKQKLTAFREARDKSRAELVALQKDLQAVLMPRQEAVLVQFGLLE